MKYNSNDVIKLIDVFHILSEKGVDGLQEVIVSVTNYPPIVIESFLDDIQKLNKLNIKDNYWGIIGYLTLKINSVNVEQKVYDED